MARLSNFTCHHVHVFQEHSENILPSSDGDVGLAASSGPSVLGDKVDEECAAADPPEISDAQNNRKRCQVPTTISPTAKQRHSRFSSYDSNQIYGVMSGCPVLIQTFCKRSSPSQDLIGATTLMLGHNYREAGLNVGVWSSQWIHFILASIYLIDSHLSWHVNIYSWENISLFECLITLWMDCLLLLGGWWKVDCSTLLVWSSSHAFKDLASQASLTSLGREVLAFDQNHWSGGCHIFFNVPVDVNSMHCLEESNQDLQLPWRLDIVTNSSCRFRIVASSMPSVYLWTILTINLPFVTH
ncbi:hypothetical protein YC2023_036813 [Brassica napus]